MTVTFTAFCYGVAFAGSFSAALFFLQFWRRSGDAFFLWFASSFALLAVQWLALVVVNPAAETRPYYYLLRLLAFVLIIAAVVRKNRRAEARRAPQYRRPA